VGIAAQQPDDGQRNPNIVGPAGVTHCSFATEQSVGASRRQRGTTSRSSCRRPGPPGGVVRRGLGQLVRPPGEL